MDHLKIKIVMVILTMANCVSLVQAQSRAYYNISPIKPESMLYTKSPKIELEKWLTDKPDTGGKFIILEFWRTSSNECKKLTPVLNDFQKRYVDDLVIISVTGESEDILAQYSGPKKKYFQLIDKAQRAEEQLAAPVVGDCVHESEQGGDSGTKTCSTCSQAKLVIDQGVTEAAYGVYGWPHVVILEPEDRFVVWEGSPLQEGHELTSQKLEKFFAAYKKSLTETKKILYKSIDTQYIAALADPNATSGNNAQDWGIWRIDPGPRGVDFDNYQTLIDTNGVSPADWKFDDRDWWLEEHGLIMEAPDFPLTPGKYVVTGDREVTTVLTVSKPDGNGNQKWELALDATLSDVTHIPCRSSRYTPDTNFKQGAIKLIGDNVFPLDPGLIMPDASGYKKQDYPVLFVIGIIEE